MAKSAPPVTEKGYVNPIAGLLNGWSQQVDQFETVMELLWPMSVRAYTRMGREDSRVASVLKAIALPIRRTPWQIDPCGASDEVTRHVASDLGLPIVGEDENESHPRTRGRFSWRQHLHEALKFLQFGHAVFEQVYYLEGGKAHLSKLAPRPQSTIAYWNVGRAGNLLSIEQWPAGMFVTPGANVQISTSPGTGQIPIERLVVYVNDQDPGVWTGNSILRSAYKHWLLKDELMRIEAAAARRHGIGVPAAWAPPEDSQDPTKIAEYQKAASAYQSGSSAGIGFPAEAKFQIMSPTGTPMDPRRAIEYHDHMIALVALAHFLNLDGKGGSYALASVQADTFIQAVQTVAEAVRDIAQAHIVEDIVDLNWGEKEPAPRLVFDEIGSRQDATAAALQMMVSSGLLTPDPRLEAFLRQMTGLPAPDPAAEPETEPSPAPMPQPTPQQQPPTEPAEAPAAAAVDKPDGMPTLW